MTERTRERCDATGRINARWHETYASTISQRLTSTIEEDAERERGYREERVMMEREKERGTTR